MDVFREVFNNIDEAYKVISEYEIWVGYQKIKIRIVKNLNDKYGYSLSHHYQGSSQAGPYISSSNYCFSDEEAALRGAKRELFSFYKADDEKAIWVETKDF